MNKFRDWIKQKFAKCYDTARAGQKWLGKDGVITAESTALLVIFFSMFFSVAFASILSAFIVVAKSALDYKNGSTTEKHDLICAVIGVVFGILLCSKSLIQ